MILLNLKLEAQTSPIYCKVEKDINQQYWLCFYNSNNKLIEKFECILEFTEDPFNFYTKVIATKLPKVFKLGSGYFFNKHLIKTQSKNKKVSYV